MNQTVSDIHEIMQWMAAGVADLERRFPYAQALFTDQLGSVVGVTPRETSVNDIAPRRGVVMGVYNGAYCSEIGTGDVSADGIRTAVQRLLDRVPVSSGGPEMKPGDRWDGEFYSQYEENPFEMPFKDKLDYLGDMLERVRSKSPRIVTAMVRYSEKVIRKIYVNRNKHLFQQLLQTSCVPVVIVSDGSATQQMRAGDGRLAGFEVARIPDAELDRMVLNAERLLSAVPVEPGVYDVVGGSGLAGVIAHEAFGHGVEADMFVKKRAKAAEFRNQSVASEVVNMFDSPAYPGLSGSYFFDDEGQPASETQIIENGILRKVLTDHRSARWLQFERTANGRRESYANKAYARMTNTYFGPGDSDPKEMIASVERGLYMPQGSNGMEDPKNWGIQVESPFAIEIKNGKLTDTYYNTLVITGYVPDLLKSISMVGNDLAFEGMGICQKGHKEQVPVAIGGPHLKMRARVG